MITKITQKNMMVNLLMMNNMEKVHIFIKIEKQSIQADGEIIKETVKE